MKFTFVEVLWGKTDDLEDKWTFQVFFKWIICFDSVSMASTFQEFG